MRTNSHPPASPGSAFSGFRTEGHGRMLAAVLLVGIVVALRPLTFYLQSSQEFSLRPAEVLAHSLRLLAIALAALSPLPVLLSQVQRRWRDLATALLLAVAVALWLQGYFFLWNYGRLDGSPLDFASFTLNGALEAMVWGAILALALAWQRQVARLVTAAWIVVAGSIVAVAGSAWASLPPAPWHERYEIRPGGPFTFSRTRNVIVLALDSSRGDVFEELLSTFDTDERAAFDGFTFFRNTTGTFNSTVPAVSGFLTGQAYDFARPRTAAFEDMFGAAGSLPLAMKRAGFVSEVYPYSLPSVRLSPEIVDNLQDKATGKEPAAVRARAAEFAKLDLVTRFNFTPHFLKLGLFDAAEMYGATTRAGRSAPAAAAAPASTEASAALPATLQSMLAFGRWQVEALRNDLSFRQEPVFKYLHFHGPHPPFFHDERFEGRRMPPTLDSYRRQYHGSVVQVTQALVAGLKRAGVYDRTMIVILGDHGLHLAQDGQDVDVNRRVMDSLRPLLLVKPFGPARAPLRTSSAPVSLFDVPATVFAAVGLPAAGEGRSVFRVAENARRVREAYALALTPDNPAAGESGAFIYRVDGDVADPAAWQVQGDMLKLHRGRVPVPPAQLAEALADLDRFLGNMARFSIHDE